MYIFMSFPTIEASVGGHLCGWGLAFQKLAGWELAGFLSTLCELMQSPELKKADLKLRQKTKDLITLIWSYHSVY